MGVFHELALGANDVEHLRVHGAQEFFSGNAGATALERISIQPAKLVIHAQQCGIDHAPDGAQRMDGRNNVLQCTHVELAFDAGVRFAHVMDSGWFNEWQTFKTLQRLDFFWGAAT